MELGRLIMWGGWRVGGRAGDLAFYDLDDANIFGGERYLDFFELMGVITKRVLERGFFISLGKERG